MNEHSPYAAPRFGESPYDERPQPIRYFKAWLLFFLLSTFCSLGAGFLIGAFAGAILAAAQVELQRIVLFGQLLGFLISLPISFICFRWATSRFILPQVESLQAERPLGP